MVKQAIALALAWWAFSDAYGQFVAVNRGEDVRIQPGCLVSVRGGWWNQAGRVYHSSDSLVVFGDVVNDDPDSLFSTVMNGVPIAPGALIMAGADQTFSTNVPGGAVRIPILRLRGTGVKTILLPAYVVDTLDLHNRLLDTRTDTVFVLKRAATAVQRADSGMVRSDPGGALHRQTSGTGTYLFPVGDVLPGEWLYRPITVEPSAPGAFAARMNLGDASAAGYDRSLTVAPLCRVGPRYFHTLWGSTTANLAGYYAPGADLYHERWARWNGAAWETFSTTAGPETPGVPVAQTLSCFRRPAWSHSQTQILHFGDAGAVAFPPLDDNRFCADDPATVFTAQGSPSGGTGVFSLVGNGQSYPLPGGNFIPALYPHGVYDVVFTYTLTDDAGHVCAMSASRQVQIDSLPVPGVEIVGSDTFCFGETVTLLARPEGYEYFWTLGNGQTINGAPSITLNRSETVTLRVTDPRSKCAAETTTSVFRGPQVNAIFSPPAKFCSNHPPLTLEGTGTPAATNPFVEYYLLDSEGQLALLENATFNPALVPPGMYTLGFKYGVRLGNTGRICTDFVEKNIVVHAAPVPGYAVVDGSLQFCEGRSVTLEARPDGLNYRWNFTHDGTNFFNVYTQRLTLSLPTTATLVVTDPTTGCQSALGASIGIGADPFPGVDVVAEPAPPFCNATATLKVTPDSPEYRYQWFRENTPLGTQSTITTDVPGRYYAVVSLSANPECVTETRILDVNFPPKPDVELIGKDAKFCEGGGRAELSYEPQAGVDYFWLKDGEIYPEGRDRVRIAVEKPGRYAVVAVSRLCPGLTDTSATANIEVVRRPPSLGFTFDGDPDVQPYGSLIRFRDTTRYDDEPFQRIWIFGDGDTLRSLNLSPAHVYPATGVYYPTLVYLTRDGCRWEAKGRVEIDDSTYLWIPDVFTPNQDGPAVNETFAIFSRGLKTFDMEIYNRWGTRVYYANSPKSPFWDGAYNGQPCPEGVYTYRLSAVAYNGRTFSRSGTVTLIR